MFAPRNDLLAAKASPKRSTYWVNVLLWALSSVVVPRTGEAQSRPPHFFDDGGTSPGQREHGQNDEPCLQSTAYVLQRQEYGYWTHFLLQSSEGTPMGVVERRHWRQPLRRSYELHHNDGQVVAKASSPLLSLGTVFDWSAKLQLRDVHGAPLGRLVGQPWTLKAAAYLLYDANGAAVAEAAVDDHGQGVVFYAASTKRVVATFLREQQASGGSDRWNITVSAPELLDAKAWPLLAAFFADTWSQLARSLVSG